MSVNMSILLGTLYGLGCCSTTSLIFINWAHRSIPYANRSAFFAAWTALVWPITLWFVLAALLSARRRATPAKRRPGKEGT